MPEQIRDNGLCLSGHTTQKKPPACVNRLVKKCTPSWIKGITLRQGPSVQVKSWTALGTSQDQRWAFASLIWRLVFDRNMKRFHEQNNCNTLCTLGFNLSLEPDFHLLQHVSSYFADWQLYLLLEFTGTCTNAGSPDSESLVWWLLSIFCQSDCGVTEQNVAF